MLTKGDDYPLHQSAEPIAFAGTDRNFYDRYFFNGYAPDGSVFFAAAMGFYPQLGIVDASFSVIVDDVQHILHTSRRSGGERLDLAVLQADIGRTLVGRERRGSADEQQRDQGNAGHRVGHHRAPPRLAAGPGGFLSPLRV